MALLCFLNNCDRLSNVNSFMFLFLPSVFRISSNPSSPPPLPHPSSPPNSVSSYLLLPPSLPPFSVKTEPPFALWRFCDSGEADVFTASSRLPPNFHFRSRRKSFHARRYQTRSQSLFHGKCQFPFVFLADCFMHWMFACLSTCLPCSCINTKQSSPF